MKSLVLTLSVLAFMAFVQTMPCERNRCGRNTYEYSSANVASSDEREFGGQNNGGAGLGYSWSSGGYEGSGGGSSAYKRGGGWGKNGGGGGRYYSRTSYCPNCRRNDFGHDLVNRNTINIKKN